MRFSKLEPACGIDVDTDDPASDDTDIEVTLETDDDDPGGEVDDAGPRTMALSELVKENAVFMAIEET